MSASLAPHDQAYLGRGGISERHRRSRFGFHPRRRFPWRGVRSRSRSSGVGRRAGDDGGGAPGSFARIGAAS
jgi:hypothetical protein